jgi:hypothetical protein
VAEHERAAERPAGHQPGQLAQSRADDLIPRCQAIGGGIGVTRRPDEYSGTSVPQVADRVELQEQLIHPGLGRRRDSTEAFRVAG